MKAVLEINSMDINTGLLDIISALFRKNISEIIVRKKKIVLEEFDRSIDIKEVVYSLKKQGYNVELIKEIKEGLEESSISNKR